MKRLALSTPLLATLACAPEFDDRGYLVETPRVLTLLAEPPEARPSQKVELRPVATASLRGDFGLRFCSLQRPLADPRPVAEACLQDAGIPLESRGAVVRGAIPADACARFGPDPTGVELRPADPDDTGGFYQPVVLDALGQQLVARIRIKCRLPDAPADLARQLDSEYRLNQSPMIADLSATGPVRAGQPVTLALTLAEDAREPYVWLPPDGDRIESRREGFQVTWFTSSGTLASSGTGRDEADPALTSSNTLTVPQGTTSATVWVVVQDTRGATATTSLALEVAP